MPTIPRTCAAALLSAVALASLGQVHVPPGMRTFPTPYYDMHTDLPDADAREADLRMTRMYEEYQKRTSAFAGRVNGKFPFYLFKNHDDYIAAGAPKESAGVYIEGPDGKFLMAYAGEKTNLRTWHVVQHEGFHQFVSATMTRDIPIWVNEGLAEYFGESLWTGDGFVTGLIPPPRLKEIKAAIKAGNLKPFTKMMTMTHEEWGDKLEYSNYTQAWAMVQFLAHADNGKYQPAFIDFMQQLSRGGNPDRAWKVAFGADTAAFEARFKKWWLDQPDNPTRGLYVKSLVQILTSFLARATLLKNSFPDPASFFTTYKPIALGVSRDLWLPPDLFRQAADAAEKVGDWTFEAQGNQSPKLICLDGDGTKYIGTAQLNNGRVVKVNVEVIPAKPASAPKGG